MPQILFASNNISHFPGSMPGSAEGTFDPLRVPYAVQLSNYQLLTGPQHQPADGNTTWYHFRTYFDARPLSAPTGASGILFQAQDIQNRPLFRISKPSSSWVPYMNLTVFNGTTSITALSNIPLTRGRMTFVDVSITITSVLIRADLYINGALACFAQFGSNPNVLTNPVRFSIGCGNTESLSDTQSFSEIIAADGDTRNARLNFLRPITAGHYNEWDGLLSALGDDDSTSGIYTKVANERHTAGLSPYIGAENLSNIVSVSQTTRGLNSPTRLRHTIRQSGVDYDSPNFTIPFSLQYNLYDLPLNPATSLPWSASDLETLEVGVMSIA
jgi:hypothetical protein